MSFVLFVSAIFSGGSILQADRAKELKEKETELITVRREKATSFGATATTQKW